MVAVSIHVPLAEHDGWMKTEEMKRERLNSRAPRGARELTLLSLYEWQAEPVVLREGHVN